MKTLGLLVFALLATGCNAPSVSNTEVSATANTTKPVDPRMAEHLRLMAEQAIFQKRFLAALPHLKVDRLYYIGMDAQRESTPESNQIQGYAILAQAKVSDRQSSLGVLQGSLLKIIESQPEYAAACFDPHHVLVLSDGKEEFHVIICFDCGNYRIFSPKGDWLLAGSFNVGEEQVWDRAFAEAGLTRPASEEGTQGQI